MRVRLPTRLHCKSSRGLSRHLQANKLKQDVWPYRCSANEIAATLFSKRVRRVYDQSTDCHPFWHIRRADCVSEINCEIVWVEITTISSSPMTELTVKGSTPTSAVMDFRATVPCIRNTEDIEMGKEVVLKWTKKAEPKDAVGQKRVINPFNQQALKSKKGKVEIVSPHVLLGKCRVTGVTLPITAIPIRLSHLITFIRGWSGCSAVADEAALSSPLSLAGKCRRICCN